MSKLGMTPNRRNYGDLTPRQAEVIVVIRQIQEKTGIPPTLDEIGEVMDITRATTHYLIRMIEGKGFLTKTEGKYRSIRLTAEAAMVGRTSVKGKK